MENFFDDGFYVYIGEDSPNRKGVSLIKHKEYYVTIAALEGILYAFVAGEDGYMTRHLFKDFKSKQQLRKETIDIFLNE